MCECAGADVFIIPVDAEIPVDALFRSFEISLVLLSI